MIPSRPVINRGATQATYKSESVPRGKSHVGEAVLLKSRKISTRAPRMAPPQRGERAANGV